MKKSGSKSLKSRVILIISVMILFASTLSQPIAGAYIVHSIKGAVTINKKGNQDKLNPGMRLTAADVIDIPEGGLVEILNEVSNTVYTSTKSGKTTVSRLMLDAKRTAADNIGNVNKQLRFGGAKRDEGARVYVETGMVKRSLAEYDPEASGMEMDTGTLGNMIVNVIAGKISGKNFEVPVNRDITSDDIKAEVRIYNSSAYPLYLNLIKVTTDEEVQHAEISDFGQPFGCYILLPGQVIIRQSLKELGTGRHFIVGAPCQFDIDATLESVNSILENGIDETGVALMNEVPVYIEEI